MRLPHETLGGSITAGVVLTVTLALLLRFLLAA